MTERDWSAVLVKYFRTKRKPSKRNSDLILEPFRCRECRWLGGLDFQGLARLGVAAYPGWSAAPLERSEAFQWDLFPVCDRGKQGKVISRENKVKTVQAHLSLTRDYLSCRCCLARYNQHDANDFNITIPTWTVPCTRPNLLLYILSPTIYCYRRGPVHVRTRVRPFLAFTFWDAHRWWQHLRKLYLRQGSQFLFSFQGQR